MNSHFKVPCLRLGTLLLFCYLLANASYGQKSDKVALLRSNEIQRKAHMENNAALLVSQIADSMINVDKGDISTLSNEEIKTRFESYFKVVKYTRWDDLQAPIIQISGDGNWAVMFVKKLIDLQYIDQDGNLGAHHYAQFAWESRYHKIDGEWKIVSISSTDKTLTESEAAQFK
ncbi:MAG: hypothetical protein R8G66_09035 [Cytophagales bacterium]|nr:hypothetical protein [Cytophagales bacterium]